MFYNFFFLFVFPVKKDMRIAQLICEKICYPEIQEVTVREKRRFLQNLNILKTEWSKTAIQLKFIFFHMVLSNL